MKLFKKIFLMVSALPYLGCASSRVALKTVENVDLQRFMGSWYVIACIPTSIEKRSYNAIETYRLDPDGTIDTIFTFNKGALSGPLKRYNPRGFVIDKIHKSTWGMQFIWPIKAEYLITHLDEKYEQTIISRNKRDYVWIMARDPHMDENQFQYLVEKVNAQGYDTRKLRRVPHDSTISAPH